MGIGACSAVWADGKKCDCFEFVAARPPLAPGARPCRAEDCEILISPELAAGRLPGENPPAYRAACTNCKKEQARLTPEKTAVFYVTEATAHRWVRLHAPGGAAG
jgi:hypothetical protein